MPMAILNRFAVEVIHIDNAFWRALKAKMVLSDKLARAADQRICSLAAQISTQLISYKRWNRFIEIVVSVAGDMGVGSTEGGEVMAFLDSLKADIVTA